jgi:signal transduction histidine kinase
MLPATNQRSALRTQQVAAIATVVVTGVATGLAYVLVARSAESGAQTVLWVGLAAVLLEMAIARWSLRAVAATLKSQASEHEHFFAKAVHDVRQPLQAATLFIDTLLHSPLEPHPLKAAISADLSVHAVRHVLDDLLDTARLDAGAMSVTPNPFSLHALLHELEAEFAPQAASRGLRFCLYCPSSDIHVRGDAQLVRLIVRKLLVHAVYQTSQGGLLLGVRQRGQRILLQVWEPRSDAATDPQRKDARGLAVASRVAALIQSPLSFESRAGCAAVRTLTLWRSVAPSVSHAS